METTILSRPTLQTDALHLIKPAFNRPYHLPLGGPAFSHQTTPHEQLCQITSRFPTAYYHLRTPGRLTSAQRIGNRNTLQASIQHPLLLRMASIYPNRPMIEL